MDNESTKQLEFLLATFDNLNIATVVINDEGSVVYTNGAFAELLEHLIGNLNGWTFEKMGVEFNMYDYHGENLPYSKWPIARILQGEKISQEKLILHHKTTNNNLYIKVSGGPVHYTDNHQKLFVISLEDITEKEESIRLLRESEEKLNLFTENAPAAIAMFDREMRYIAVSKRWLENHKITRKNVIGALHYDVVPDLPQTWKEVHQRGLNGETLRNDNDMFPRQDGSVQFLKWEVKPWFNNKQEVGGVIIITEDITEQKINEEKIRVAYTKYKTLFDNIPIGVSISDDEGRIFEANAIAEEMLGITEEEHIERRINDRKWQIIRSDGSVMPTEEFPSVRAIETRKKVENVEIGVLKPDNTYAWVNVTAAPFKLDGYGVIVTFHDITARKEAEKKLKESEKRFANIFYDSPIPIAISRPDTGELILINQAMARLFGFSPEEIIGKTTLELGFWDDPEKRKEYVEAIRSKKIFTGIEAVITLRSGEKRHAMKWGEMIEYYGEECMLTEIIDITEKKNQAEKIKEQHEKLNAILHSLPDRLFVHDAEGNYLEAYTTNPDGFVSPPEDFLGKNIRDQFPPEIAEPNIRYLKQCLREKRIITHEYSTIFKGNLTTYEVRIVPFRENQVIRFVRDITKNKEIEKQILRLNTAIEESPIAIIITDIFGNINYTSKAFESITGYRKDEVMGLNMSILKSGKNTLETYAKIWDSIKSGKVWEGELINKKKNGTFYWEQLSITPLYENENELNGYLAIMQDITEKKKNEEKILELNSSLEHKIAVRTAELQNNQDKLMLSQHIAKLGIWEFNTRTMDVKWSDETYRIFERSREMGPYTLQEFQDSILPEDRHLFLNGTKEMTNGESLISHVLRHYTDKGNLIWVKYYMKGIPENGEVYQYMGTLIDITAEKERQLQLERAVHEAEEANMAKSAFLANMSHEIRTPLNSIIGFSELLYHTIEDEKKRSQISSIRNSGKSLLRIINDILDLSKVEAGKIILESEPLNVLLVVKEVCNMFEPTIADKKLYLNIECESPSSKSLLLDGTRLRQILFNLVGNAIKFTAEGGVTITIHQEEIDEQKANLEISIRDTGIGIAQDQMEDIFQPFVQQKGQTLKAYGGTGLGLTISRRMAEAMGGEITVKNNPDRGSTFTIIFSEIELSKVLSDKYRNGFVDYEEIRFKGSTILIVDDIEDNRKLLLDALEHTGARLLVAEDGLQAVQIATKEIPNLILMDKRMPVMDGMKACKLLKENPKTSNIICIGMSATLLIGKLESDSLKVFDDNLVKPISFEKLFALLNKYLGSYHHTSECARIMKEMTEEVDQDWSDELKQYANDVLLPKYHRVMSTQLMDEMEEFGKKLEDAGQQYGNNKLIEFGTIIEECVEQFDVERLSRILKDLNHYFVFIENHN